MINEIENNSIVITRNSIKNAILLDMSKNKIIKNIKFIDINEFKKNYLGTYDINAIYYLMKKYNYSYDIAKYYLDNIFYNFDKLSDLYNELNSNNLLIFNELFKRELLDKNIYVIGYNNLDKYLVDILKNYNSKYIDISCESYDREVLEFKTIDDEINFVFQDIIDNHINELDKVYLVNVDASYTSLLKRLSKYYNININIKDNISFYSIKEVKNFINELSISKDLNKAIDVVKNVDIKNKLIEVLNKNNINIIDDIYIEIITSILKYTYKENIKFDNSVNIINFEDMINNDYYYYVVNFNQGSVPRVYHDDELISDKIRKELYLNTSIDKVLNYKNSVIKSIKGFKNVVITYKLKDYFKSYEKSSLIDELNLKINKDIKIKYNYSNKYNKLYLGMLLDKYHKYNEISEDLIDLYTTYKDINYLTYDNKFKGVDYNLVKKYLNNKLNLSYSSMNYYYHCKFRYYINNILRINIFEDTFQIFIGNLYHFVLSKMYDSDFDFESTFNEYLKLRELSAKERFFITILKEDLKSVIDVIKFQDNHTTFKDNVLESEINIDKSSDLEINFNGKIDKIKYSVINGIKYVCIIDYKTGNVDTSLDNITLGFNMQLPIYMYLIKNEDKDIKIEGFYFQKILSNRKVDSDDIESDLKDSMKLVGYSLSDEEILESFDNTYVDSDVIKSMKKSSNGFYKYSKLFNDEDVNTILNIVDKNINEVIDSIKNGDFKINPKRFNDDLKGCTYCNFKDICFRKEEDIVNLNKIKFEDLKEGE